MVSSSGADNRPSPHELPQDISFYCSADLDEVLYPNKKSVLDCCRSSNHLQPHSILLTNPQDFLGILPPEVIVEILKYLDVCSLLSASQTCRSWRNFIANNSWLWKWFCLNRYDHPEDVHKDRDLGYDWQNIFQRCIQHHRIRRRWLNGEFSNFSNFQSVPEQVMTTLTQDEWGTIFNEQLMHGN